MRVLYLIPLIKILAEIQNCVSGDIEQEIQQQRYDGQYRGSNIKGQVFPDIPGIASVQLHPTASSQHKLCRRNFPLV